MKKLNKRGEVSLQLKPNEKRRKVFVLIRVSEIFEREITVAFFAKQVACLIKEQLNQALSILHSSLSHCSLNSVDRFISKSLKHVLQTLVKRPAIV